MANDNKVIIEFIGDPSGLKPAVDALKAIGKITDEQVKQFQKSNAEFQKTTGSMDNAAKSAEKIGKSSKGAGKSVDELRRKASQIPRSFKKSEQAATNFNKSIGGIMNSVKRLGVSLGIAFGVNEIKNFIVQSVQLAAKAEGIETAFRRIGNASLLGGLRRAVRGTVSDVELMKQAVRASNFKIPLQDLAKLFEFARRRAKETGESVDYLVNSIVLGIGRKSPLILDNLGISAVELRKRLSGVSAEAAGIGDISKIVGQIATEELEKMGDEAITTADRMAQISASFENMQVEIGKETNKVLGYLDQLAKKQGLIEQSEPYRARIKGTMEYANAVRNSTRQITDEYQRELRLLDEVDDKDALVKMGREERAKQLAKLEIELEKETSKETIKNQEYALFFAEKAIEKAVGFDIWKRGAAKERKQEALGDIKSSIIKTGILESQIKALKQILALENEPPPPPDANKSILSISSLNEQLKDLKTDLENAALGGTSFWNIADKITKKSEQLKKVLDELKFRSEFLDERGRFQFQEMPPIKDQTAGRFGEFDEFQFVDQNDVVVLENLNDSLAGLNVLLGEAVEKRSEAGEFTSEFDEWNNRVEMLEKRIEQFGERVIETNDKIKLSTSDIAKKTSENWEISAGEIIRGFGQMFDVISSLQSRALSNEQKQLEYSLEQGEISRESYEARRKKLLREQAKQDKSNAIFAAIINTAAAIVEALPNIPLSLLAGVIGAAQIGAIASQPIPQFAKGTKNAPAGFKWVGENGAELVYDDGGYPIITHSESNVINDNPYSSQSRRIMSKYDIPQIHTGLFGQKSIGIRDDIEINSSRSLFDYDQLSNAMVQSLRGNTRNTLNAIDRHRMVDRDGFEMVVRAISRKQNNRASW